MTTGPDTNHRWPKSTEEEETLDQAGISIRMNTCSRCGTRRRSTFNHGTWVRTRYYGAEDGPLITTTERGAATGTPPCPGLTPRQEDATLQRFFQIVVEANVMEQPSQWRGAEPLLRALIRKGVA